MGTILSFRYVKPGAIPTVGGTFGTPTQSRVIIVLTKNWMGNLHGIKVSGLTQTEQEYLQMIFQSLYRNGVNFYGPLLAQIEAKKAEIELLNKNRARMIEQGQRVIVKPQEEQPMMTGIGGQIQRGWKALGSVVGKIRTFGATPKEPQPTMTPFLQQTIQEEDAQLVMRQQELDQWVQYLENEKAKWSQIGNIPTDPYRMYHNVVKPMLGRERMPDIYRKFKVSQITNPRIISSPRPL